MLRRVRCEAVWCRSHRRSPAAAGRGSRWRSAPARHPASGPGLRRPAGMSWPIDIVGLGRGAGLLPGRGGEGGGHDEVAVHQVGMDLAVEVVGAGLQVGHGVHRGLGPGNDVALEEGLGRGVRRQDGQVVAILVPVLEPDGEGLAGAHGQAGLVEGMVLGRHGQQCARGRTVGGPRHPGEPATPTASRAAAAAAALKPLPIVPPLFGRAGSARARRKRVSACLRLTSTADGEELPE